MNCKILSSEEKIREAAKSVFLRKGFSGTTARDIAEASGTNIALTNYYFRSKEKLFGEIFQDLFSLYCENTIRIFERPVSLKEKLMEMIEEDYRLMKENPNLVLFIMNEIHRSPDYPLAELSKMRDIFRHKLSEEVRKEIRLGRIRDISADHIMPLIIGSLQFIFMCKSLQMSVLDMTEASFGEFAEKHKDYTKEMVISFLFSPAHEVEATGKNSLPG